ncbi:hypothetical protein IAE22_30955, partial [Bacillus sp. S34]|nr:hypothetical protein [Bacillus sp. S34]
TADRIGRRRTFQIGLALFTVGSLLCSIAPGVGWLVVAGAVLLLTRSSTVLAAALVVVVALAVALWIRRVPTERRTPRYLVVLVGAVVVAVVELDLDALVAAAPELVSVAPIVSYPAARQDLSLVVGSDVPAGEVLDAVRTGAGDLLEYSRLLDDYPGT